MCVLGLATVLSGSSCFVRAAHRSPELKCAAVGIVFRQRAAGGDPEFVMVRQASGYFECPANPSVPPAIMVAWQKASRSVLALQRGDAVQRVTDPTPIAAQPVESWTEDDHGVVYASAQYTMVFPGCDFWFSHQDKCELLGGPAAAQAAP